MGVMPYLLADQLTTIVTEHRHPRTTVPARPTGPGRGRNVPLLKSGALLSSSKGWEALTLRKLSDRFDS